MPFFRTFLMLLLISAPAKAFDIAALGGLNYAAPTEHASGIDQHFTGDAASDFGITLGEKLFDSSFDFETGFFLLSEKSEQNVTGPTLIRSTQAKHIPFIIRYRFDDSMSLGLGGYASFYDGNVDTNLNNVTTRQTSEQANLYRNDFGILISLRAKLHLTKDFFLVLDARYQHGLTNLATQSADVHNTRSIQTLAGILFYFWDAPKVAPMRNRQQ